LIAYPSKREASHAHWELAITGLLDGGLALNDVLVLLLRVVRQLVNIF
jgi:hypothetical protein